MWDRARSVTNIPDIFRKKRDQLRFEVVASTWIAYTLGASLNAAEKLLSQAPAPGRACFAVTTHMCIQLLQFLIIYIS